MYIFKWFFNKHSIVVIVYLLVLGHISYLSLNDLALMGESGSKEDFGLEAVDENYFQDVKYFVSKEFGTRMKVHADEASILDKGNRIVFFNPIGQGETKKGDIFDYKAKRGLYLKTQNYLMLETEVDVTSVNMKMKSNQAEFFTAEDRVVAKGDVKSWALDARTKDRIRLFSDFGEWNLKTNVGEFKGQVDGTIKRFKVYEESVDFKSEILKLNMLTSIMNLEQKVFIKKQDFTATAHRGEILLDNYNKKLKYYSLSDDVKVTEKLLVGGKPLIRKALAEHLDGHMNENKVVLTGSPRVFQESDTIKGNIIILRPDTEVVEVDDANTNFILR